MKEEGRAGLAVEFADLINRFERVTARRLLLAGTFQAALLTAAYGVTRRGGDGFRAIETVRSGKKVGGLKAAQIFDDLLLLSRILASQAGECVGDDVAVVQVLNGWIAAEIEPEAMD